MTGKPTLTLNGKTVFITGAASGFGAACAQAAYTAGANVVLLDSSKTGMAITARGFIHSRTLAITANLSDLAQIEDAVAQATEKFGGIDVAFANIGLSNQEAAKPSTINERFLDSRYDINLLGIWNTVRACLPQIKARNGHIQITSSSYGYETGIANAPHKIPKIAVELFNRELRKELAGSNASAGVFFPGWVLSQVSVGEISGFQIATELLKQVYYGKMTNPAASELVDSSILEEMLLPDAYPIHPRRASPIALFSGCRNLISDRNFNENLRYREMSGAMSMA